MTLHKLALMVTSPPHNNNSATALAFAEQALLNKNVELIGVFFYQDGVLTANKNVVLPNDELQAVNAWKRLYQQYQLPLHLCISAGEKRGLSDHNDDNKIANISPEFTVSGLGELVSLTTMADRVVQL